MQVTRNLSLVITVSRYRKQSFQPLQKLDVIVYSKSVA